MIGFRHTEQHQQSSRNFSGNIAVNLDLSLCDTLDYRSHTGQCSPISGEHLIARVSEVPQDKGMRARVKNFYEHDTRHSRLPGGFFHLEEERTKTRAHGYGHGDYIKLTDEYGNTWRGSAVRGDDNSVSYRFRDGKGNALNGVSSDNTVTLRDTRGSIWKGFIG